MTRGDYVAVALWAAILYLVGKAGLGELFSLAVAVLYLPGYFYCMGQLQGQARALGLFTDEQRLTLIGLTPEDLKRTEEALCAISQKAP